MREYKVNREDNPLKTGDYPLAFFEEKAKGERGARRALTLAEGEILHLALLEFCEKENAPKTIEKAEFGKLKFTKTDKNIKFSFSHSAQILVLCVSDEGEVGVDVEKVDSKVHKGAARFLEGFYPTTLPLLSTEVFEVTELPHTVGRVAKTALEEVFSEDSFLLRWTALEAVLKMSGEGLAAYKSAASLLPFINLSSGIYTSKNSDKYLITLAKKL